MSKDETKSTSNHDVSENGASSSISKGESMSYEKNLKDFLGETNYDTEKAGEDDVYQQVEESLAVSDENNSITGGINVAEHVAANKPEGPTSHETSPPVNLPKRRGRRPKNIADTNANTPEKSSGKGFASQFSISTGFHASVTTSSNFRLDDLRLSNDFCSEIEVVEVLSPYEIRKPGPREFIRVHPGEDYQIVVGALKEKIGMGEKLWLVGSDVRVEFSDEVVPINLRLAITRSNRPFLWPLNVSSNGNSNPWNLSALHAAETAKTAWVRLTSKRDEGRYDIYAAKGNLPDPIWPDSDFGTILELAFAGRVITDLNHPYLRQLRGEE